MKIKEMHCEVCNHTLDIRKENVYTTRTMATIFGPKEEWDATDCPYCGCQNLLKIRYAQANQRKKTENETQENV